MTDTAFGTRLAGRFKKNHKSCGNVYNGIGLAAHDGFDEHDGL
jgi:hypothetical protein